MVREELKVLSAFLPVAEERSFTKAARRLGVSRTIVVDDEQPARLRLLELLNREADIDVTGTAADGREAVDTARIRELRVRSHGDFTVVLKDGAEVGTSRGYRAGLESWLRQPI